HPSPHQVSCETAAAARVQRFVIPTTSMFIRDSSVLGITIEFYAAARFQSTCNGPIMTRNTLPPDRVQRFVRSDVRTKARQSNLISGKEFLCRFERGITSLSQIADLQRNRFIRDYACAF